MERFENKMNNNSTLTPEQQTIRTLSERIVAAQKPIRILDALKWDAQIKAQFFAQKEKQLPVVDLSYYQRVPLSFNPQEKREEFYAIERDIKRLLGQYSAIGIIMIRMCREYRTVIRMIEARGTSEFGKISQELYGSSEDVFYPGAPTLNDLAITLSEALTNIKGSASNELDDKCYTAEQAVVILQSALDKYFTDPNQPIHVELSDGIVADAAAGAESIKLKREAMFSQRDLKILEVHEGWVHVGTTLNGLSQPICTFLSKGPPSSTITQEGLAVIMELFTFSSSPTRVHRVTNRINAIHLAEEGANFIEVYNFYLEHNLEPVDAYNNTARIFRGSTPTGLPFTKDLAYSKGFITIYNYIRLAIRHGLLDRIPLLFLGKTCLQDIHVYVDLIADKILVPPKYVPPQFHDLAALTAWMCYSLFLNKISLERLGQEYKNIL